MRYIFVDEAGTSTPEPVTVVVGLIADADRHVMRAESLATEVLGGVPSQHKDGFVFHATDVFGSQKYQVDWSPTDRLHLLLAMMSIPARIGMAITVAASWRGAVDYTTQCAGLGVSPAQMDHLNAFSLCLAVADRNIRKHAGSDEVASVVAEDVPELRSLLKRTPSMFKRNSLFIPPDRLRKTPQDIEAGHLTQSGEFRVARIRSAVHFVEKSDDPLVQVADACAFGLRRYFAGERMGGEFVDAILGSRERLRNFSSPGGVECYWPA